MAETVKANARDLKLEEKPFGFEEDGRRLIKSREVVETGALLLRHGALFRLVRSRQRLGRGPFNARNCERRTRAVKGPVREVTGDSTAPGSPPLPLLKGRTVDDGPA